MLSLANAMDASSVLVHLPSGRCTKESCPRRETTLTMVPLLELWKQVVLTSECVTQVNFLLPAILVTFTHADKFLLPSQPRLRLYLLSSVSSITDFTFFHSPSLFNTRTFFSPFGFKTILEILHKEVSTSVLNTLRSK